MKNPSKLTQASTTLRLFWRAITLTWRADRLLTLSTFVLLLVNSFVSPLQIWITKWIIDAVAAAAKQGAAAADTPAFWQSFLLLLALYVGIWTLGQVVGALDRQARGLTAMQVDYYLQRKLFGKASQLDTAFYDSPSFHNQFTLARSEKYRIYNVVYLFAEAIQTTITGIALFALLGQISAWFPLLLVLTATPHLLGKVHFTRREAGIYIKAAPIYRLTSYLTGLLGDRDAVKEIRLFQTHDYLIERIDRANRQHYANIFAVKAAQEKALILLKLLMAGGAAAIWGFTGWQAITGVISLGSVALVFQAVERGRDHLFAFSVTAGSFAENTVYLQSLFGFLDLSPDAAAGALERSLESVGISADLSGVIRFDHVSFRYPGQEEKALDDVSFEIRPGETVALVGENGAGKTTLVKLLTRLYDPVGGSITIAGRDLRQIDPQCYHRQISVIFQDFRHYELSVKENIGFGYLPDIDNMERIRRAAELGGAAEMIAGLPQQYETMLGRLFYEDSQDLSGGEWQKIALARAFMRDVPLLILDEPTAALDAFAENAVYNRFAELTRGRTTIFVTHRLASVQMAQKILVLKEGRLIEAGAHDELMARGGEYARMFNLQAQRYQSVERQDGQA